MIWFPFGVWVKGYIVVVKADLIVSTIINIPRFFKKSNEIMKKNNFFSKKNYFLFFYIKIQVLICICKYLQYITFLRCQQNTKIINRKESIMGKFNSLRFKDERRIRGYTQEQIANILGITKQAVQRWEQGRAEPSPEHIVKINKMFSHCNSAGRDINFFTPESDLDKIFDALNERIFKSETLSAEAKIEVMGYVFEAKNAHHESK